MNKRILVFGGLFSQLDILKKLLKEIRPTYNDHLIFLGDYLGYGPQSGELLAYLTRLRERHSCIFLKGDHEDLFLGFWRSQTPEHTQAFVNVGGQVVLDDFRSQVPGFWVAPSDHITFLENLPSLHLEDEFCFVHAGLRPGVPIEGQLPEDMRWIGLEYTTSSFDWGKTIVSAHGSLPYPLMSAHRIVIGGGLPWILKAGEGRISCVDVRSRQAWLSPLFSVPKTH